MSARCETIGKYVLPVFRALVARELVTNYHLKQTETAKKLGTTQAAVSQYVASKRAVKGSERVASMMPKIQQMASQSALRLAKNEVSWADVASDLCKLCSKFTDEQDKTRADYSI